MKNTRQNIAKESANNNNLSADACENSDLNKTVKQIVSKSTQEINQKINTLDNELKNCITSCSQVSAESIKNKLLEDTIKQVVSDCLLNVFKKIDELNTNVINLRDSNVELIRLLTANKSHSEIGTGFNSKLQEPSIPSPTINIDISDTDSYQSDITVVDKKDRQQKNYQQRNVYTKTRNPQTSKNGNQNKILFGTADSETEIDSEFSAAEKKLWIYIGRCKPDTTEDKIMAYLQRKCPNAAFTVESLQSRGLPSYKLSAPADLEKLLYTSSFWPKKVLIKRFDFRRTFRNNKHTTHDEF